MSGECDRCSEHAVDCRCDETKNEWVFCKERMPPQTGIMWVRKENGEEVKAYFHADHMGDLAWYYPRGMSLYFQDHQTKKFLQDVTHWYEA